MRRCLSAFTAFAFIFLLVPLFSHAMELKGIEVLEYGIFKLQEVKKKSKGTVPGQARIVQGETLVEETDQIPGVIGVQFGLRFVLKGSPEGEKVLLEGKLLHPCIKNPKTGEYCYSVQWQSMVRIGEPHYDGWGFDDYWEIATGEWTFVIFCRGKKLLEKKFLVYTP
jgi:uncharacterized protein DUF3859